MTTDTNRTGWITTAILMGRLIFAAVFTMAVSFKLMDINTTADYIAAAGFRSKKCISAARSSKSTAPEGV
jgi:putative oxidoreductase